jgi:lysophospholipase L1-like esterase
MRKYLLALCVIPSAVLVARAAEAWQLLDGDRVVLVGSTLIEREQRYGYWETALIRRYPGRNIMFRNLGWSGDTVFGEARAGFDTPADGFRRLKEHVLALRPTVIFVAYGTNESFEGEPGLPRFRAGLAVLLDALAPAKARTVLLSPLRQEDLGRPLPNPTEHNYNLRLYCDVLRQEAEKRHCAFMDLYELSSTGVNRNRSAPLTDNGIHLTAYGYWQTSAVIENGVGLPTHPWHIDINADGKATAAGTRVEISGKLRFRVTDDVLPAPRPPTKAPGESHRMLRIHGLTTGKYSLHIDGKPITVADAPTWASGVNIVRGPELDQVEQLRQAIIAKNRLYFYRWRPQNETYLFGFRKHEQGQNAREVPLFDPLVANVEKDIARLRVPIVHDYEIVPQREEKK